MSVYPPGGPVYAEQVAAEQPPAPSAQPQVTPELIAAVAAQLQQAQPAPSVVPPPPVQVAPAPPPAPRREVPVDADGVADFDALWSEHRAKAKKIRALGTVYTLAPVMPASVVVFYQRHRSTPDHKFGADEILEMLGALLGEDNLKELLAKGLGLGEFEDLLKHCMRVYSLGEDEGEATAEAARASSA